MPTITKFKPEMFTYYIMAMADKALEYNREGRNVYANDIIAEIKRTAFAQLSPEAQAAYGIAAQQIVPIVPSKPTEETTDDKPNTPNPPDITA